MHSNDTTLNAINSVSVNAMKNGYGISSFVTEGSADHLYLEAFLALDTLLEQDEIRETYNAAMVLNEEGGAALSEEAKYVECGNIHIKESEKKLERSKEILFPLKKEIDEAVRVGRDQIPDSIKKKLVEANQLRSSAGAHNKASRYALDMAKDARERARAAFDRRDEVLSKYPEISDALTTMELIGDQVSDEIISVVEQVDFH